MSEIRVSFQELRNKADELKTMNEQLRSALETLDTQEGTLLLMWEGDAKNAFHTAYTSDRGQMESLCSVIDQFYNFIIYMISSYLQVELLNQDIAQTRTYC